MTKGSLLAIGGLVAVLILGAGYGVGAAWPRLWEGKLDRGTKEVKDDKDREGAAVAVPAGGILPLVTGHVPATLTFELVDEVFDALPLAQRFQLVKNPELFKGFLRQEVLQIGLVKAVKDKGVEGQTQVARQMERAAARTLAQIRLGDWVRTNLADKKITDEQVLSFFQNNPKRFQTEDRIHVWQIFFLAPEGKDAERREARAKAEEVAADIKKGKQSFSEAAERYSAHLQSSLNGGYMGLIKMSELLPEVRTMVEKLPEGAVSDPIRSTTGYHILLRGAMVPGRKLTFDRIAQQVRLDFVRQTEAGVQEAVMKKVLETYPSGSFEGAEVDAWRARLQVKVEAEAKKLGIPTEVTGGGEAAAPEAPPGNGRALPGAVGGREIGGGVAAPPLAPAARAGEAAKPAAPTKGVSKSEKSEKKP